MSKGWIGVGLDGTLAKYDTWRGPGHIGEPITAMVDRVRHWLLEGLDVRIFTARVAHNGGENDGTALPAIEAWCEQHIGRVLRVTCVKDWEMLELWDDRAVQVEPNTGRVLGSSARGL